MKFTENYQIDYAKKGMVDKKGQFSYISWAHAQKIMREQYPEMKWQPLYNEQNNSLVWSGFVKLLFTNEEESWEIFYPILDNRNKPIAAPNQFDLNNAQMRGFAKGFAMITGHGLNLFTGEDLTQYETVEEIRIEQSTERNELKELTTQFLNHSEIGALDKKTIDATIKAGAAKIKAGIKHLDRIQKERMEQVKKDLKEIK